MTTLFSKLRPMLTSEARTGLNGGSSFRLMTSAQDMCLKNGWVLIGSASAGPLPSL